MQRQKKLISSAHMLTSSDVSKVPPGALQRYLHIEMLLSFLCYACVAWEEAGREQPRFSSCHPFHIAVIRADRVRMCFTSTLMNTNMGYVEDRMSWCLHSKMNVRYGVFQTGSFVTLLSLDHAYIRCLLGGVKN